MTKQFCDICGEEIGTRGLTIVGMKVFSNIDKEWRTMPIMEFCKPLCATQGLQKWLEDTEETIFESQKDKPIVP